MLFCGRTMECSTECKAFVSQHAIIYQYQQNYYFKLIYHDILNRNEMRSKLMKYSITNHLSIDKLRSC